MEGIMILPWNRPHRPYATLCGLCGDYLKWNVILIQNDVKVEFMEVITFYPGIDLIDLMQHFVDYAEIN